MRSRRAAKNGDLSYTINASEIGEYAYCSRAWWYRHVARVPVPEGASTGRLAAGIEAHDRHGAWVASSARLRTVGIALGLLGLAAIILALVVR